MSRAIIAFSTHEMRVEHEAIVDCFDSISFVQFVCNFSDEDLRIPKIA